MKTLKEIQNSLGMNQKEFAVYCGVSTRTMNGWMSEGQKNTCPAYLVEMIERVADADSRALENAEPATSMMRWAVISADGNNEYMTAWGNKADAIRDAEMKWDHMTGTERERAERFTVGLVRVQLTDRHGHGNIFTWAEDENGVDGDIYETAKEFAK